MRKVLIIDPSLCTGCRVCEAICSMVHEGRSNPAESRISIISYPELGIDVPMTCQQCEKPLCQEMCPMDAIYRDESTGAMLINEDECTGCYLCVSACPIGGIGINPITEKVIKCNLCGGEPACVKFCSVGALQYVSLDEAGIKQRREKLKDFASFVTEIAG